MELQSGGKRGECRLGERTEEDKAKMYFCLDAIKALTKAIKNTDSE